MSGVLDPSRREAGLIVLVKVDTAATAVDIAHIVVDPTVFALADTVTYLTVALNLDEGRVKDMAILAGAEDTAAHFGSAADGDIGGIDEGHVVVSYARKASRGAEDMAVVAAIGANAAAGDADDGLASTGIGHHIGNGVGATRRDSIVTH